MILSYFYEGRKEEKTFQELEQLIIQTQSREPSDNNEDTSAKSDDTGYSNQYNTLHDKNSDYWGWIKIEGTNLSYPVMYTPSEPEYYLHHDFNGNYSSRGVPFLDGRCTDDSGNYIIYGHHMKDGSMFSPLLSYADQEFYVAHPTILLSTENGLDTYTILAAFYSKIYSIEDSNVFRYYQYTDIKNHDTFDDYINQVKSAAIYDTGVVAEKGDQLLTLSTCSYHEKNGRFVVVAVKDSLS